MNYYELLQVDKKASIEIIDKAFRLLAKKYHPDTQPEDKKQWAEQKFKELNQAYEILSDAEKRIEYDATLEEEVSEVQLALIKKNQYLSDLVKELQDKLAEYETQNRTHSTFTYKQPFEPIYQAPPPQPTVEDYQYEYARKDKYHSLKNFISFFITLLIIIIVFAILWFIPFTHNWFTNLYENNAIIKGIIDLLFQIK